MKTERERYLDRLCGRLLDEHLGYLGQAVLAVHRESGIKTDFYPYNASIARCERVANGTAAERIRAAECLGWAFRDTVRHTTSETLVFGDAEAKQSLLWLWIHVCSLEWDDMRGARKLVLAIEERAIRETTPPPQKDFLIWLMKRDAEAAMEAHGESRQ